MKALFLSLVIETPKFALVLGRLPIILCLNFVTKHGFIRRLGLRWLLMTENALQVICTLRWIELKQLWSGLDLLIVQLLTQIQTDALTHETKVTTAFAVDMVGVQTLLEVLLLSVG